MEMCIADVKTAYLNADNDEEQYMYLYKREVSYFIEVDPQLKKFVDHMGRILVLVKKALYGLAQSAKLWYSHLADTLRELGYTPTLQDKCAFVRNKGGVVSYVGTHVDDLLMAAKSPEEIERLKRGLEKKYPGMKFKSGESLKYLGMEIFRNKTDRSIKVSLDEYTVGVINEYQITSTKSAACTKLLMKAAEDVPVDTTEYLSLLMKLMYIAKHTRPDILFTCSYLSTQAKEPKEYHWIQLIHLLKYLNGTHSRGLLLTGKDLRLHCYADAAYAIHADAKSQSGISVHLGELGPSIFSQSLKQKIVSQSSTEAELIALHAGAKLCVWLHALQKSLGIQVETPIVFQDNTSTMSLATGGRPASNASKHINVRYFSVKEYLDDGLLLLRHMPTTEMIADLLTKPLVGALYSKLTDLILGT
jgi:hypothetical protein